MKQEYLNHLDRAFTEAPLELVSSVEEGFRRGEIAVKQRHKILTALSVAAILTVLFAAIALAAGAMLKPRVDRVVTTPRGGGMGDETLELPLSEEAPPVPTGVEAYPEDQVYYATQEGVNFHTDEHCQGMHNALPISWDAAWIKNKWPCPECVDEARVPHLWLWCTARGVYYHMKEDCSGMKDAQRSYPQAVTDLKEPCPVCVPDDLFTFCWATPLGQYYHAERECMAMRNARIYTAAFARYSGKQPCPICNGGAAAVSIG